MKRSVMVRNIMAAAFVWLFAAGQCHAVREATVPDEGPKAGSATSYLGNYKVVAPSIEMAATYAKYTEDLRKRVAHLLGDNETYGIKTFVTIQEVESEEGDARAYSVAMLHGGSSRDTGLIQRNRVDEAVNHFVVHYYLLDMAAKEASSKGAAIRDNQIPLWMTAGVLENMTREDRDAHRNYMLPNLEKGKYIRLKTLFTYRGKLGSGDSRALYYHQCGSLFDYLTGLPHGKERIRASIRDLWNRDELAISLLWHFKDDFSSVGDMEKKWIESTKSRPEKFFDFTIMTAGAVLQRLDEILVVEITSIDKKTIEEKVEKTDLPGLMKHKNASTRTIAAFRKMAEIHELKLHAPKECQEMLSEYVLALRAISGNDRRKFNRHYKKANKLLKALKSG